MKGMLRLQSWAGPLVIGSFAVMSVTGVMMFFHWNAGASKLAHEWLGWLLVIGGIAHVLVNWRAFLAYFRKPVGVTIVAAVSIVGLLSLLPVGGPAGLGHRPPFMIASNALEQSSLSLVAQVAKRDLQSATDALTAKGIRVRNGDQTIADIASDNGRPNMEVLACVIGGGDASVTEPAGRRPRREVAGVHE